MKKVNILLSLTVAFSLLLAACQPQVVEVVKEVPVIEKEVEVVEVEVEKVVEKVVEVEAPAEVPTIRVGVSPYYDYQWIVGATQFGWDTELGIDLEPLFIADNSTQVAGLTNGDLEVATLCLVCAFQFYPAQAGLRTFMTTNEFQGFAVIGRRSTTKSYTQYLDELGDEKAAMEATINDMAGKAWPIYLGPFETLVTGMLGQVGLGLDDINLIGMADDQKAAAAFIQGEGDYYIGSLPQEVRMLLDFPDEFHRVGGYEIIGPGALWFSNYNALGNWLAYNEDSALKMMAMNYRWNRIMNECPEKAAPILAKAIKEQTGADFTEAEVIITTQDFEKFRTYQEEIEEVNNPDSASFWGLSAEYYMSAKIDAGDMPEGSEYTTFNPLNEWMDKFVAADELTSWVDAPGVCD